MSSQRYCIFILCLHFHFATIAAFSKSKDVDEGRIKRASGDQAPEGKCLSFKWEREDAGNAVDYVCCNNCGEANQNCLGTSYQSGSSGRYCDSCGGNNLGSARKVSQPFSCGGCDGQTEKANICRARYSSIPAACWLFRGCFEKACQVYQGYAQSTCFNGICDEGENVDYCPADCCWKKNPQNCTRMNGECPLKCCGESSCCKEEDNSSSGSSGGKIAGIVIGCLFFVVCCMCGGSRATSANHNEVHPTSESGGSSSDTICVVCF